MVPDQCVDVKVFNQTIKLWRGRGFDCFAGDVIRVPITMLGKKSHYTINAVCDYCGEEYTTTLANIAAGREKCPLVPMDCCATCQPIKARDINMLRYGAEFPAQRKEVIQKMKDTTMLRYGVENISQLEDVKAKKELTMMSTYGVPYYAMTDECKEKARATCMERFGCEYALQSAEVRAKGRETCLRKYGVDSAAKTDWFQAKKAQTNLERYGYENAAKSPVVQKKIAESFLANGNIPTSKPQLKLYHQILSLGYDAKLNYLNERYFYDVAIFLDDIKIDVEYDGVYWHRDARKDELRDSFSIANGWKVIRFIGDDTLPPDDFISYTIDAAIAGQTKQVISVSRDGLFTLKEEIYYD